MGNQRDTMKKWKSENGIQYYIIQNPLSPPHSTAPDLKVNGQVHADGGQEIDGLKRYSNGRRSTRYKTGSPKSHLGVVKNSDFAASTSEVARRAAAQAYAMPLKHTLYPSVRKIEKQIKDGIQKHGGVLISERVHISMQANPETGVRDVKLKGSHCVDGAASVEDVIRKNSAEHASIGTQRGKDAQSRSAKASDKFPIPPVISAPPYGMVEAQFLIWAEPAK